MESGMLVDFKIRSKLYNTYSECVNGAEYDFNCRLEVFYEEDIELKIQETVVVNPAYAVNPKAAQKTADEYSDLMGAWEETCAAAIFFFDEENPAELLMKYEIYFAEDGIEIPRNGDLERYMQMQEEDEDKFPSLLH